MKGCLTQRYKGSWSIVLDVGYQLDPITGMRKRKQRCITVKGTKRDAEKRLAELVHDVNRQQFVEPSKRTLGEWLDEWVEKAIKPAKAIRTYESYRGAIDRYLKPNLGGIRLQELKAVDLERYYAQLRTQRLERSTTDHRQRAVVSLDQAASHDCSTAPCKPRCSTAWFHRNVAKLVKGKPKTATGHLRRASQLLGQRRGEGVSESREGGRSAASGVLRYGVGFGSTQGRAVWPALAGPRLDGGHAHHPVATRTGTHDRPVFGSLKNKKAVSLTSVPRRWRCCANITRIRPS